VDPDFIPYWTQNIVCTAVKFLSLAAKRAVTHQREHHHGYTAYIFNCLCAFSIHIIYIVYCVPFTLLVDYPCSLNCASIYPRLRDPTTNLLSRQAAVFRSCAPTAGRHHPS
jgi:hypothetical protein